MDSLDTPPLIPPSPIQPEPPPEPTVRCHDCGQLVPVSLAVRRDVVVSWHDEAGLCHAGHLEPRSPPFTVAHL